MDLTKCIWLRSATNDRQPLFAPLLRFLKSSGVKTVIFDLNRRSEAIAELSRSDAHVIVGAFQPRDFRYLKPFFQRRGNFSLLPVDWWTVPAWWSENAQYLIFQSYSAIAARTGLRGFDSTCDVPVFNFESLSPLFPFVSSLLRFPSLLSAPLLDLRKKHQRLKDKRPRDRMLYFPFAIDEEQLPPPASEPSFRYEVSNLSSTAGYWRMRDPYAPAFLDFANLYHDRRRVSLMLRKCCPTFFDIAQAGYQGWNEYKSLVRDSAFVVASGGLHCNAVAKYFEFTAMGAPMIGEALPFEFSWLKDCLVDIDMRRISQTELIDKVRWAASNHRRLRNNCLDWRPRLLRLYSPEAVFSMLQSQINGGEIPPDYLLPSAGHKKSG